MEASWFSSGWGFARPSTEGWTGYEEGAPGLEEYVPQIGKVQLLLWASYSNFR
jgi:hypothetical protein